MSAVRLACCVAVAGLLLPFHESGAGALPPDAAPGWTLAGARSETIEPNDNTRSAGENRDGVLTLRIVARTGTWIPEGADGPHIETAAFAEEGGPLSTPGPMLRAPVGTRVRVAIRNALGKPLWVHGLGAARGIRDSVVIAPGASHAAEFTLDEAGSYYYAARTTPGHVLTRLSEDSQLHGLIIADPPGARPAERLFVISSWFTIAGDSTVSGLGRNSTLAVNGLSWPHTERIDALQGDSLRWRFINISTLEHPMHLHGFYFRVDGRGDGIRDTVYTRAEQRLAVTELLLQGRTMAVTWSPERSGNWVFHCHFASHIATRESLEQDRRMPDRDARSAHAAHGSGTASHMQGLVIGIRVAPRGEVVLAGENARPMRIIIRSKAAVYGAYAGYAFVLGGSGAEPKADSLPVPGPALELVKGEPVAINIINHSHDPAAIHWHGIELESFPDGVPGWSGSGTSVLPMIPPGDSLTVRFTPPRAGTFMYHSHSNEFQQISSGLYGAIVVREPGAVADPVLDQVVLFSDDGPTVNFITQPAPATRVNGRVEAAPLELRAGERHRLRFINIRTDHILTVAIVDGDAPVRWRVVAKDGAVSTPLQAAEQNAELLIAPGEIYDVELVPPSSTSLALRYRLEFFGPDPKPVRVPMLVRR